MLIYIGECYIIPHIPNKGMGEYIPTMHIQASHSTEVDHRWYSIEAEKLSDLLTKYILDTFLDVSSLHQVVLCIISDNSTPPEATTQ
ncbi:hypothetical protein FRB99_001323, partial [Tulasnella sp. 403]